MNALPLEALGLMEGGDVDSVTAGDRGFVRSGLQRSSSGVVRRDARSSREIANDCPMRRI